jgi:hypothetical protein
MNWIERILTSRSSSVLLNGVPGNHYSIVDVGSGKVITCHHFFLCLLWTSYNALSTKRISRACSSCLFYLLSWQFPIVQYVDDTILVMKASQRKLFTLKGPLESFSQSIGPRVNYKKSCLVPLNLPYEKAQLLAVVFVCKLESLPFTYIGLPLGATKPRVEHYGSITTKVERRLTATSIFLTHVGRLQPTYAMYFGGFGRSHWIYW